MQFGPSFGWLKRLMPRGLYGRAVLILLLPVFTMVLVVTVVHNPQAVMAVRAVTTQERMGRS